MRYLLRYQKRTGGGLTEALITPPATVALLPRSLVPIITAVYLPSPPFAHMWPKTPQICDRRFELFRGGVIWALQWGYLLALFSLPPPSRRHCLSSHLQSRDTSGIYNSLEAGTRRKIEGLTEALSPIPPYPASRPSGGTRPTSPIPSM